MKGVICNLLHRYRQLITYGIIGCCCAGLDFLTYVLLMQAGCSAYVANVISVHVGIIASFFLNRHFTFRVKNKTAVRFLSFYLVGLTGLAISTGMLFLMIERLMISPTVSKIATIVVVALIQFILNKYISFKQKTDVASDE
jgi:putative flippase GtrA